MNFTSQHSRYNISGFIAPSNTLKVLIAPLIIPSIQTNFMTNYKFNFLLVNQREKLHEFNERYDNFKSMTKSQYSFYSFWNAIRERFRTWNCFNFIIMRTKINNTQTPHQECIRILNREPEPSQCLIVRSYLPGLNQLSVSRINFKSWFQYLLNFFALRLTFKLR